LNIKKLSVNRKASKREVDMKRLMRKFEQIYAAVAFAEAGEADTAREIMREEKRDQKRERVIQRPRKQLRAPGIKR
jgi:ribosomal protein L12E/L44/L45/RPP1/RPP2